MKKRRTIFICLTILMILAVSVLLSACNRAVFDTHYKFDRAVIKMPDGSVVSGKVDSWLDFDDGDQLQVKIDGKTYLTHATNVMLVDQ